MLNDLRSQIDALDAELVALICKRIQTARQIGQLKKEQGLPMLDEKREEDVLLSIRKMAKERGLSAYLLEEIMQLILQYSKMEMEAI